MTAMKLSAQPRDGSGKGVARKLRRDGKIPAVLYRPGEDGLSLVVSDDEFAKLLAKGQAQASIIRLQVRDGKESTERDVLIREIQTHPFKKDVYHIDLQEITMDQEISVKIPVEIVGESIGVEMGGILEFKRRELEITCLPGKIPDSIVIDITELDIGDSVHVESIVPPEGVTIPHDVNFTILTVVGAAPEEEEEVEELEEEVEGEAAEPEVIGKGKEEDEEPTEE
ncbi:50S ribosomal protein L25 [bacterium]|nr:MAG: 50S ribosomal protein L25 [bacterium]